MNTPHAQFAPPHETPVDPVPEHISQNIDSSLAFYRREEQKISDSPNEAGWGTVSNTLNPDQSLLSEKLVVPTVTYFCDIPTDLPCTFPSMAFSASRFPEMCWLSTGHAR